MPDHADECPSDRPAGCVNASSSPAGPENIALFGGNMAAGLAGAAVLLRLAERGCRDIADGFRSPTDDFLPVMLLACADGMRTIAIPPEALATIEDQTYLATVFLPRQVRENRAFAAVLITSAWVVDVDMNTNEGFGTYLRWQSQLLNREPNGREKLCLELVTATTNRQWSTVIVRSPVLPPLVGPLTPCVNYQSRFTSRLMAVLSEGPER